MTKLDWQTPYASNRSPLFARNVVATSQPLATQAGIQAMRDGGNAVDAALATAIALTVVEPNMNGIGSDAFAIVWDGSKLHGLNASGRSPAAWSPQRFEKYSAMPTLGWEAVTVPGAVSAWVALSEKFGRLPFERLFEAAIHYAREGYQVGPKTGDLWQYAERTFKGFDSFGKTFLPGGKAPAIGTSIQLPDHATTLAKIAGSRGEAFYRGELADAMIEDAIRHDGAMTHEDLANHRCEWVDLIEKDLGNVALHEIPPNGQGLMALIALGIVDALQIEKYAPDSADSVHLQIEATRLAYADIERHLADIAAMTVTPAELIADERILRNARRVDPGKATINPTSLGASPDTVYLTAADQGGMMVSMIQSNFRGFGSGIVIPGTGISMQNRGSGFTLEAGHPNQVGGSKRPYHTIIPGFATSRGQPRMSFGVMGGHMQAQGHLQMMIRVFTHGQNPQAASDAPRWYLEEDGIVCLEDGFDPAVAAELESRGHRLKWNNPEHLFGGAQLIYRMDDGYCAGSDHRKEGLAAGF